LAQQTDPDDAANKAQRTADRATRDTHKDTTPLETVIVTATRTPQSIAAIPGSVTVITREALKQQSATFALPGLGDLLGKAVPGLGLGFGTGDSFGQNLRGRAAVVLIDGVPQDTQPVSGREYLTIDPEAIERIEVIRGATAIYGNGAAGGVINIITRKPGADGMQGRTSLGMHASLTHPSGSLGGSFAQEISGRNALLDYVLQASLVSSSGQFDAQGDRSAPGSLNGSTGGLLDTRTRNFFGKLGKSFDQQRVQLTLNRFESQMDTDLAPDPAVDALCPDVRDPGCVRTKARYVSGISIDNKPFQDNTQISVDYDHAALWGSRLHAQVFHRELNMLYTPFDARVFGGTDVVQAGVNSKKRGARLEVTTPLSLAGAPKLLWGLDYLHEKGDFPSVTFDAAAYDASGGRTFRKVAEGTDLRTELDQKALFAQVEWRPAQSLLLRAGMRYEDMLAKLPDQTAFGTPIRSGSRHFRDTVFNAGAVFYPSEALDVFVNYAQGFTAPRLDVLVFSIPADGSLSALRPESNVVDNYEVGLRWQRDPVQAALSLFYAKSSLGAGYNQFTNRTVESPERTHGFEATLDVEATRTVRVGGTLSYVEGKTKTDAGTWVPLNGFRIAPLKATLHLEHLTAPSLQWRNRLQLVYSGSRDRSYKAFAAGDDPNGDPFPTRSFAVVDLYSSLTLGGGRLEAGIENLFNKQYELPLQQIAFANSFRYPSSGARLSVKYALSY
jgi:iron complex outermembrane receptor protein